MKKTHIGKLFCLLALTAVIFALGTGCGTTTDGKKKPFIFFNTSTNSIEHKGQFITQVAVAKVLQKHPPEKVIPKLEQADADLDTIINAETISVAQIQEIIDRLPPDTFDDPDTTLYIRGGILFFSDELETIAAQNPEQLRAAARGMKKGLKPFLPKQ